MGRSSFHSLQYTITKRMSKGLSLLSSYTWSHSIDTSSTSDFGWHSNQDQFNVLKGERAIRASIDDTFTLSLPSMICRSFRTATGPCGTSLALGMAGIFRASTGGPFNLWTDMDNNFDGFWSDRPDQVGDPLRCG